MAAGVQASGSVLRCPMIDARRMEVYTALYDSSLTAVLDVQPMVLDDESFAGVLEEHTIIFFGDGSCKYESLQTHPNAIFIKHGLPDAQFVGGLAYEKYENGLFADVAYFEPFYLKEFRATKPKPKF